MGQVYRSLRDYKKGCGGKDETTCSVLKTNAELNAELNLVSKKEPSSELASEEDTTEDATGHNTGQGLTTKAE